MQYVFLVGGLGSRLGTITQNTPKPLLKIGGIAFLNYLITWAKWAGASEILLLSGYRGSDIERFACDTTSDDCPISIIQENEQLGTAGSLINAYDKLAPTFILSNGDSWLAFNPNILSKRLVAHSDLSAVMALRKLEDTSSSGIVRLGEHQIISSFEERGGPFEGLINAGVYAINKECLDKYIDLDFPCSIEKEVFPNLVKDGKTAGIICDGYFIDIGTPERLNRANADFRAAFHSIIPLTEKQHAG